MVIPVLTNKGVVALVAGKFDLKSLPGYAMCPNCGKLFEPAHAERKPRFCEDCGAGLKWERERYG